MTNPLVSTVTPLLQRSCQRYSRVPKTIFPRPHSCLDCNNSDKLHRSGSYTQSHHLASVIKLLHIILEPQAIVNIAFLANSYFFEM